MGKAKGLSGALLVAAGCVAWSFSGMLSKWTPWGALSIMGVRALLATLAFAKRATADEIVCNAHACTIQELPYIAKVFRHFLSDCALYRRSRQ